MIFHTLISGISVIAIFQNEMTPSMNVQLYQTTEAKKTAAFLGEWNCLPAPKGEGRYDCKVFVAGKSATLTFVHDIYSQTFVEVTEELSN